MKKTLTAITLTLATTAHAQITIVEERPRYVTIEQEVCEQKEVIQDNRLTNGVLGGLIGAALGKQVGNGSGKEAATVAGAIIGTNIGRNKAENNTKIVTKNVCHKEIVQVQRGKYVTMEYEGQIHTILVD